MKTLLIKAGLILKGTVKNYTVISGTNVQCLVFSCYFIAWYCIGSNLHQNPLSISGGGEGRALVHVHNIFMEPLKQWPEKKRKAPELMKITCLPLLGARTCL